MTAPQTRNTAQARAAYSPIPQLTPAQVQFFHTLGHNNGAREIVAGKPDARGDIQLLVWTAKTFKQPGHVHTREWIEAGQDSKAARHIIEQAEEWGNVYASIGTYSKVENTFNPGKMRYCRDIPLPRHCFMLDDVRDLTVLRLHPTMALETSPGNFQVVYRCDTLLAPGDAVKLATGAATLAGSDKSGSDATQIMRIPDTRNTKPKNGPDGWPVRLVYADGPTYSREQLARTFLPGGIADLPGMTKGANASSEQQHKTADHIKLMFCDTLDRPENLRRGGPWLTEAGALRRPKPDHFINNVLTGANLFAGRPDRASDTTYTGWRWNLMLCLWLHGYPEAEIRVLTFHLASDDEGQQRSTTDVLTDIDRILAKLAIKNPRDENRVNSTPRLSTGNTASYTHLPRAERRTRKDRPGLVGGADNLAQQYATRTELWTLPQTERAKAIGIALATIKRLEILLKAEGRLVTERVITAKGWAIYIRSVRADVELTPLGSQTTTQPIVMRQSATQTDMESTPAFAPAPQSVSEVISAMPVQADEATQADGTDRVPETTHESKGGVCSPSPARLSLCASLSDLRTLIREAFDTVPRLHPNTQTGELGKVTVKRVTLFLKEAGVSAKPETVKALMQEERYRRQEQALYTMSLDGLRVQARIAERKIDQGKCQGTDVSFWRVWLDKIQSEMRQRPPEPELVKQRRRKGGPVCPDQRYIAAQEELELLELVDAVLGRAPVRRSQRVNAV